MFTQETYKQLKLFFKLTNTLCCLPFRYDEITQQLQPLSIKPKLCYLIMLLWLVTRAAYHFSWIVYSCFNGFPSITDTTVEIFFAITIFFVSSFHIHAFVYSKMYMKLLNAILYSSRVLKSKYLLEQAEKGGHHPTTGKTYQDGCDFYIKLLTPAAYNGALSFGAFFMVQPNKRLYYYYFLPPEDKTIWTMGMYAIWECFSFCWQTQMLYLLWYQQLMYSSSTSFWLQQIIGSSDKSTLWTKRPLAQTQASLKIYQSMQVITMLFQNVISGFPLPMSTIFVFSVHTISIFVPVKFHAQMSPHVTAAFVACAGLCFTYELISLPLFGKVQTSSAAFLRDGDKLMLKEFRLAKKALPVLKISTWNFYAMRRDTVLTKISLVFTGASNLLVST